MRSPSIQSRPLSLQLCNFWSPRKGLRGKDSPRTTTSSSMCRIGSQRSPGNFMRQPFTALCRSETSASTARANTSDIQVLVSVPRSPASFFLNAVHICSSNTHLLTEVSDTFIPSIICYFYVPFQVFIITLHLKILCVSWLSQLHTKEGKGWC